MALYDESKMKTITGSAKIGPHVLCSELLQKAMNYKKNVAKRYYLIKSSEISKRIREEEMYVSTKLDGHFSYLYKDKDDAFIFNYSGRVIKGLSVIDEAVKALQGIDQAILPCELYLPDETDGRSHVYNVTNALGEGSDKLDKLKLAVFDILELNGESYEEQPYEVTDKKIKELIPAEGRFHHVNYKLVKTDEIVSIYTEEVTKNGHEGIIARSVDKSVFKIKPRHNVDAAIIGFTQRQDNPEMISALLTALMRPDGSFQVLAKVGTGFDEAKRLELYEMLKPLEVDSYYNEADGNHTLFTMVKPVFVMELDFMDVLMEKTSGKPIYKAVLSLENDCYNVLMPEPFVNLIAPIFAGIRSDKEVNAVDLRLTQLQPYVDLGNLESGARQPDTAKSELIRREVYTKETKGLISVRKFISWKTNKEEIDESFPGYVFCYVDYSPGRKGPLKRIVRVSNSPEQLETIFNTYIESEVKRGWNPA